MGHVMTLRVKNLLPSLARLILLEAAAMMLLLQLSSWGAPRDVLVFGFALSVAVVGAYALKIVRRLSIADMLIVAVLNALGLLASIQLLGFFRFPGIVKDVVPWTEYHLTLMLGQFALCSVLVFWVSALSPWGEC
jgi:hypothetical protein